MIRRKKSGRSNRAARKANRLSTQVQSMGGNCSGPARVRSVTVSGLVSALTAIIAEVKTGIHRDLGGP